MPSYSRFPIPSAFFLMGKRITVDYDPCLIRKEDVVGRSCYREDRIVLQASVDGQRRSAQQQEQTFFHELLHWILDTLAELELNQSEKFVDTVAGLLHQAFTTAEYERGP